MSKQTTCPMCMTKMQPVGHDLVCPVCGYKYCGEHLGYSNIDHDHNNYKSYNQKTTYSGPYTTTSARPGTQPNSISNTPTGQKKKRMPIAIIFVIAYFVIVFLGVILEEMGSNLSDVIYFLMNAL